MIAAVAPDYSFCAIRKARRPHGTHPAAPFARAGHHVGRPKQIEISCVRQPHTQGSAGSTLHRSRLTSHDRSRPLSHCDECQRASERAEHVIIGLVVIAAALVGCRASDGVSTASREVVAPSATKQSTVGSAASPAALTRDELIGPWRVCDDATCSRVSGGWVLGDDGTWAALSLESVPSASAETVCTLPRAHGRWELSKTGEVLFDGWHEPPAQTWKKHSSPHMAWQRSRGQPDQRAMRRVQAPVGGACADPTAVASGTDLDSGAQLTDQELVGVWRRCGYRDDYGCESLNLGWEIRADGTGRVLAHHKAQDGVGDPVCAQQGSKATFSWQRRADGALRFDGHYSLVDPSAWHFQRSSSELVWITQHGTKFPARRVSPDVIREACRAIGTECTASWQCESALCDQATATCVARQHDLDW